jgi:hypothetical protein
MRGKLIALLALAFALAAPAAQAQEPDPQTCAGYPEPRVFLESQSWWHDLDVPIFGGDTEHVHTGVCMPLYGVVDGTVRFDVVSKLHNLPWQRLTTRVQDSSSTLQTHTVYPTGCQTMDCTFVRRFDVNLGARSTGMHELRFHSEARPTNTATEASLATDGWQVCVRSCSPNVTQATSVPEGRGWYRTSSGSVKGYINGRFNSQAEFPWKQGFVPVSGVWCPPVRILRGAGDENVEESFVSVDPDFHAGNEGQVLLRQPGTFTGRTCVDTTTLANGRHKLFMRAHSNSQFTGQLWGALVIPFEVANP